MAMIDLITIVFNIILFQLVLLLASDGRSDGRWDQENAASVGLKKALFLFLPRIYGCLKTNKQKYDLSNFKGLDLWANVLKLVLHGLES